jgi:hypothetical protein
MKFNGKTMSVISTFFGTGESEAYQMGYTDGYDIGFAAGEKSKMEVHKITVPSDQTSGTYTLLANNEFIKNNYTKDGFFIQLISLPPYAVGDGAAYAYNGNILIPANGTGDKTADKFMLNRREDGEFRVRTVANVPYFNANGNVLMATSTTNGILKAGDYLLILSVAEVQE